MSMTYKYTVTEVDYTHNLLLVQYEREGMTPVLVSLPIPYSDVALEEHVKSYAPYQVWEAATKTLQVITPGVAGVIQPVVTGADGISEEDVLKLIDELKAS